MPNWVSNTIILKSEEDLKKFQELLVDENGEVDFEKLIPMPKDLDITAGSYEWKVDKYGFYKEKEALQNEILKPLLDDIYNENMTQERFVNTAINFSDVVKAIQKVHNKDNMQNEDLENVLRGYYNLRKYGFVNWYDFHNIKWGTKWNASETCNNDLVFFFQTAWSTPMGIWQELSKHLDFKVAFADEDIGCNFGIIEVENGEATIDFFEDLDKEEQYYISSALSGLDEYCYEEMCQDVDVEPLSEEKRQQLNELIKDFI